MDPPLTHYNHNTLKYKNSIINYPGSRLTLASYPEKEGPAIHCLRMPSNFPLFQETGFFYCIIVWDTKKHFASQLMGGACREQCTLLHAVSGSSPLP